MSIKTKNKKNDCLVNLWIFWIYLRLFLYFSVIFWISLMHQPIIAPLGGSHGPESVKDVVKQARRATT